MASRSRSPARRSSASARTAASSSRRTTGGKRTAARRPGKAGVRPLRRQTPPEPERKPARVPREAAYLAPSESAAFARLTERRDVDLAVPGTVELAEEDALPRSECEFPLVERHHDLRAHQRGPDV